MPENRPQESREAEGELRQRVLRSDLPSVVSHRSDLETTFCSLRIESAAHAKLPPELLAQIFLFCSPPTEVVLPPKSDHPLLTLTQICRTWRELALDVPELWATISVTFAEEQTDVERITDVTFQWLSRARDGYSLSITAECTGKYAATTCENPSLVAPFVSMVISHAHRLRHFELGFPMTALLPLFALPHDTFSSLETMWLRPLLRLEDLAVTEPAWWHWPSTSTAFTSAPLLREIAFAPTSLLKIPDLENNFGDDILARTYSPSDRNALASWRAVFAPTFLLPWSQLRALNFPLTALTAEMWCTILAECTQLEELSAAVKPSLGYQCDSNPEPPINLNQLTVLGVAAYGGGGEELIDRLVAPALTTLLILGQPFPAVCLTGFQLRSSFVLKSFMPFAIIPAQDFAILSQHFSDVTELSFFHMSTEHFPTPFWERLGRADLLPKLEVLIIRPTATQASAVVDMIASRWDAAVEGHVPNLRVSFCDVKPAHLPAISEELRRLEKYAAGGRVVEMIFV
ncbi:F-box domain-containing protein [Mycena sanguinolenta]|uniref:F-box domain-containing protein n=1 Tax=Mycena sanguinolenta TaxID=230812 RepID=A0A8H6XXL3_9AGAR|nr:F-box domain-containing protein [Mycena sanguinolenta]